MKPLPTAHTTSRIHLCLVVLAAIALTVVPWAATASTPLLRLNPIVVANGAASVSGNLTTRAAGATLSVNGKPVTVDAAGTFGSTVRLDGASAITLGLNEAGTGQQTTFAIPLTGALLGPGGVIPSSVLDSLEQAGVSLLTPVGGLQSDGQPLTIGGSVADKGQLAGLTVNGQDVLGKVGEDGSFSVQLPGSTRTVTVRSIDRSGNSQTTSNVVHTSLGTATVSAANAVGLRIVSVRFYKRGVAKTRRVRMVVTVKDRRGRLVRGARIGVSSTKARRLVRRPKATLSGRKGRATFTLRLRPAAFGRRLTILTTAKTPSAKARKLNSIAVPRATKRRTR